VSGKIILILFSKIVTSHFVGLSLVSFCDFVYNQCKFYVISLIFKMFISVSVDE